VALLIDILAITLLNVILLWTLGVISDQFDPLWFRFIPILLFFFYFFGLESVCYGQTPGKMIMKLQVVRIDGADLQPGDLALRAIFHLVDSLGTAGALGALLISTSPLRQRIGDMAAGVAVIRMKPSRPIALVDLLSISTLNEYQPQFEAVRQMTEADMLLIKNALSRYQQFPNEAHRRLIADLGRQMARLLSVDPGHRPPEEFLKILIQDYIVLTR
jgi:uncharacterized RDD family membrane protein YckC